jgi:ABC-2 type transport system permease protein
MRRSHYLMSFIISRLIFLLPEVAMLVAFAWLVFGVRVFGSILDLTIVAVLGSMTFAGMGLLVASRARTIEAASGWMNFIMMPMWLMSGSFFNYSNFPDFLHPFIRALPLTALNDAMRAVMNDGLPLTSSWIEMTVMAAWGIISFIVALRIFRWQ